METIQTITLTATNFKIPATVHAVQNDTGRLLRMIVADTELPEEATAELAVKRSDGSYYNISCELEAEYNAFLADLTQALTQSGDTQCQLKVDGIVSTYMFIVSVQADVSGVSVPQMGIYPQTLLDAADQIMYAQNDVKLALLQLAEKVAYIDADGQQYYDDLYNALYPPVRATSVVLSNNSLLFETVGLTKTLTATVLPVETSEKVVWGTSDPSVCTVANGVVTSVGDGSCTITATAGMVKAECNVVVSSAVLVSITAEYTQSGTIYDTYLLDTLREDLVVTAEFSDNTSLVVDDYTLSGTLEAGDSTIYVEYSDESTSFTVAVSSRIPSAYKQVEYIQSSGNQVIVTDIIPRNTRTKVTFEFTQFVGSESGSGLDNFVTGVYNANNMRYLACSVDQYNNFNFKGRDNSYQWRGPNCPTGKHTVDFNDASHRALYDGEVEATSNLFSISSGDNKLAIFARGHASNFDTTYGYAKVYSLECINNDTGLSIGNFIPCYRKIDGVIGMYDLVSETFYQNANSGDPFTKGADAWETGE